MFIVCVCVVGFSFMIYPTLLRWWFPSSVRPYGSHTLLHSCIPALASTEQHLKSLDDEYGKSTGHVSDLSAEMWCGGVKT